MQIVSIFIDYMDDPLAKDSNDEPGFLVFYGMVQQTAGVNIKRKSTHQL